MKITVVTPTIMRASLRQMVDDVAKCLLPGDEHLIIRDGLSAPRDPGVVDNPPTSAYTKWLSLSDEASDWGNAQRDLGIQEASGDCIVFLDDDDMPAKGGYDKLHSLEPDSNMSYMFMMSNISTNVLLTGEEVRLGGVSTQMFVTPNRKDLPKWADDNSYGSDYTFIKNVLSMPGMGMTRHELLLCLYQGQHFGA